MIPFDLSWHDVVTAFGYWLAIGCAIWALLDPARSAHLLLRSYVARKGRLPGLGFVLLMHVAFIVAWPKLVVSIWQGFRAARARRVAR